METGIVQYYRDRNGNAFGVPVVHIAINLQAGQDAQTDNFVRQAGFTIVGNDVDRQLASRFQRSGQPIFAIINGVANSPNAQQWELLLNQSGYGTLRHPIDSFRAIIDQVKPGPAILSPAITTQPENVTVVAGSDASFSVTATGTEPLTYEWRFKGNLVAGTSGPTLTLRNVSLDHAGEYSVVIRNAGGEVASTPASLAVNPRPVVPPTFQGIVKDNDGSLRLLLSGTPGTSYRIEVSTDLFRWAPLANVSAETGQITFVDPGPIRHETRFYRAVRIVE